MDDDLRRSIAETLDADVELLPHLPALLADLEELGTRTTDVTAALANVDLPENAKTLDLGCGKGAVARLLAARFCRDVLGIDAMPAFIDCARQRAAQENLAHCRFQVADLREVAATASGFGTVCLTAGVGVLGELTQALAIVRECVEPGGLVLIDDAFVADDADLEVLAAVGCHDRATTRDILTGFGDAILAEHVCDGADAADHYREQIGKIARRADALVQAHPTDAERIGAYVERQRREIALLTGPVVGALWVLRRGG